MIGSGGRVMAVLLAVLLASVAGLAPPVGAGAPPSLQVDETGGGEMASAGEVRSTGPMSAIVHVTNDQPFWVGIHLGQQTGSLVLTPVDASVDIDGIWAIPMVLPPHGTVAFEASWDPRVGGSEAVSLRYGSPASELTDPSESASGMTAVAVNILQLVAYGLGQGALGAGRTGALARGVRDAADILMKTPEMVEVIASQQGTAPSFSDVRAYAKLLLGTDAGRAALVEALGRVSVDVTKEGLHGIDRLWGALDAFRLVTGILDAAGQGKVRGDVTFRVLVDPTAGTDLGSATWRQAADAPYWRPAYATVLTDGRIAATDGSVYASTYCDFSIDGELTEPGGVILEIYDPAADRWHLTRPTRLVNLGTMVPLPGGELLYVGTSAHQTRKGRSIDDPAAEILSTDGRTWRTAATPPFATFGPVASLPDGRVLLLGGDRGEDEHHPDEDRVAAYDPATDTWSVLGRLRNRGFPAAPLTDGTVVVGGPTDDSLAVFDPATGRTRALDLPFPAAGASALPDGAILVATDGGLRRVDPVTGEAGPPFHPQGRAWVATAEPARLLSIRGYIERPAGSCQRHATKGTRWVDPATGEVSGGPALPYPVWDGIPLRLPDGRIVLLVEGGREHADGSGRQDGQLGGTLILEP